MSSSNISMAVAINNIKQSMYVIINVWSICLFALGIIGHALNIYVFISPEFRSNPCARYFLASTLSGCGVVYLTVPLRLLQAVYNIDVFKSSALMCQILSYVLPCFRVLASWFIALASVDRYLCSSSSVVFRRWSNIRVASRLIPITVLFVALVYIHMPFYYAIVLPQQICAVTTNSYQTFYAIWNLVFWSWIPTSSMVVFGLLTVRNVRQGKRRIAPQNQVHNKQQKKDRQLIQMLLVQSFVFGSTTTALSIGQLYVSITNNLIIKSGLDTINDTYMTNILNSSANIGPCFSFYLFTLSSRLFRRELISLCCRQKPTVLVYQTNTAILPQVAP